VSSWKDPVEVTPRWRPEPSPGGIGQPKTRASQRFREKASPQRWREIRARKLGPCLVCRYLEVEQERPSTLHHVVAKSLGGSDTEANCVPLCGTGTTGCHGLVEKHDPDTCALFAAAVQRFDDAAYAYAIEKLGEDGWLRRYYVWFRERS
jgi:5-methylcytosine-specific restriction endonuclease McrA